MTNMPATPKQSKATGPLATSVSVAEAKARLSSIIHGVEKKHTPVTILRRGIPVAQLIPFPQTIRPQLAGSMAGTARILGDIVTPYLEEWTVGDWPEPNPNAGPDPDDD
jgi:prevent-host-death family protein